MGYLFLFRLYVRLLFVVFEYVCTSKIKFYTSLSKHFFTLLSRVIFLFTYHTFNTTVYYHHCTSATWSHGAVKCCSHKGYASFSCLTDSILCCMHSTHTMVAYFTVFVYHFLE